MAAHKRLLIETLLSLGANETLDLLPDKDTSEVIRACLLHASSSSPEACELVDRVAYETYAVDTSGTPYGVRGLVLPGTNITLREFVEGLNPGLTEVPECFAEGMSELTIEDYRAGIYVLQTLLYALEWSEHDHKVKERYAPDDARVQLRAVLRSLDDFRRHGEP